MNYTDPKFESQNIRNDKRQKINIIQIKKLKRGLIILKSRDKNPSIKDIN